VRWDELFADLSAQGEAHQVAQDYAEAAERGRWEAGQAGLGDRLAALPPGSDVGIGLASGRVVEGRLLAVGADWLAVLDGAREALVPLRAVRWLRPVPARVGQGLTGGPVRGGAGVVAAPDEPGRSGAACRRLTLRHAIRSLVRDRSYLQVTLLDGHTLSGTADRAGLDHFDLAQHPADLPRRAASVQAVWLLAYDGVVAVHGGQVWSAP
jgi:hypothetical protein